MVGKPCTPFISQSGLPSEVQSTSAMTEVLARSPLFHFFISLSQAGFIDLQWPHHGAKNLMNTVFPVVSLSQFSGVSSRAPAVATTLNKTNGCIADLSSFPRNCCP